MKIEVLQILNFRGIKEIELTGIDPHLNVFVGANGVGKSTILEALKLLFRKFQFAAMEKKAKIEIKDDEVFIGESVASLYTKGLLWNEACYWGIHRGKLEKPNRPFELVIGAYANEGEAMTDRVAEWRKNWQPASPPSLQTIPESYPLLIHYPVTRAVLDIPLRAHQRQFGEWSAWSIGENDGTSFRAFFTWFRNQEDLENQVKAERGADYRDPQLNAVRGAIEVLLPGYSNLRIQRWTPVRMLIKKNGNEISIQQLSDGEKCLLALVGDLARRLAMANPGSANPLDGTGIVLIDELDLHLHPQWQIEVIPRLLETFPNCQFFISTHSPLLVSHAKPEQIFLLETRTPQDLFGDDLGSPRVQVHRPAINTYGQDMNLVVSTFMGAAVREPETQKRLQEIFASLADPDKWRTAMEKIETLRQTNSDLPDLVKAQAIFDRKELLAR